MISADSDDELTARQRWQQARADGKAPNDRAFDAVGKTTYGCGVGNPCGACRSEDGTDGFD